MARRAIIHAGKPTRCGTAVGADATTRSAVRSVPVTPSAGGWGRLHPLIGQNCGQSTPFLGFVIEPAAQIVAFAFYLFKLIPHPGKLGLNGCSPGFSRCFRSCDFTVSATVGGEHPEQFGRVNLIRAAITARHTETPGSDRFGQCALGATDKFCRLSKAEKRPFAHPGRRCSLQRLGER